MQISAICVLVFQLFGRTSDTPITAVFWSSISSLIHSSYLTTNLHLHTCNLTNYVHYLHLCSGMIYGLNRLRSFLLSLLRFPSFASSCCLGSLQKSHVALQVDIAICFRCCQVFRILKYLDFHVLRS